MADTEKPNVEEMGKLIEATFGKNNTKDTETIAARIPELDDGPIMIAQSEMYKLVHVMITTGAEEIKGEGTSLDMLMLWGWLTAAEFLMTYAEAMPARNLLAEVEGVREQITAAVAKDTEMHGLLSDLLAQVRARSISTKNIEQALTQVMGMLTTPPEATDG